MRSRGGTKRVTIGVSFFAGLLVVLVAGWMLFYAQQDLGPEIFPALSSSTVVQAPNGHAYQYVAAARDGLIIVSFDGDLDRTPNGKKTPAEILAESNVADGE